MKNGNTNLLKLSKILLLRTSKGAKPVFDLPLKQQVISLPSPLGEGLGVRPRGVGGEAFKKRVPQSMALFFPLNSKTS
ncbi:MAG: hypothetical protein D8H98_17780 [Prevotella sp.]|nr:MAG: hypothetical protein D8H98_17780 [Prevotella sp.]